MNSMEYMTMHRVHAHRQPKNTKTFNEKEIKEACSKTCQTSRMGTFAKTSNGLQSLTIFEKTPS